MDSSAILTFSPAFPFISLSIAAFSSCPTLWLVNTIFHISFNPIEHLIKKKMEK